MAPEKTDYDSSEDTGQNTSTVSVDSNHTEPYFEPVVTLPQVEVITHEEEEEEMLKIRCKLFRYHNKEEPPEWKERGTGNVKLLWNKEKKTVRLLMRQDKTHKVRANHYITPYMELKQNCNSDRAWVWSVRADFADEEPKYETFAVRFVNAENARIFKEKFDEARGIVTVGIVENLGEKIAGMQKQEEEGEEEVKTQETKEEGKKEEESSEQVLEQLENLQVSEDSESSTVQNVEQKTQLETQ